MITEDCKLGMHHLSNEHVYLPENPSDFYFEETQPQGAGKAYFSATVPCVVLRASDKPPLLWALKNRKCAEGAFVTFEADGCKLHILEMKSKLTQSEWAKVLNQFEGMYLAALASARLMGILSFKSVTCYIAFKEDAMGASKSADMIMLKTFVGASNPVGGADEWMREQCDLPFSQSATIRKGQRDAGNDVRFGVV